MRGVSGVELFGSARGSVRGIAGPLDQPAEVEIPVAVVREAVPGLIADATEAGGRSESIVLAVSCAVDARGIVAVVVVAVVRVGRGVVLHGALETRDDRHAASVVTVVRDVVPGVHLPRAEAVDEVGFGVARARTCERVPVAARLVLFVRVATGYSRNERDQHHCHSKSHGVLPVCFGLESSR